MPNLGLSLLLLALSLFYISGSVQSIPHKNSSPTINKLCKNTTYPQLCVQYLSIFPKSVTQNPKKIPKAGLLVSLYRVHQTRSYIKKVSSKLKKMKVKGYGVVQDCLEVFGDEVSELSQAIIELHQLSFGRPRRKAEEDICDIPCHVFNIQSYLSGALTDASTCVDEFGEILRRKHLGKLMATIKSKALNAEQATTNGLDLFCQIAKCNK